jgi:uncharacterized protein with FMN-binding domain
MEEVEQITPVTNTRKKNLKVAIGLVVIVVVGVLVVLQPTGLISTAKYKDGTYETVGNYMSPGGEESIKVKLTLVDNVVTDAEVVSQAERPNSVKFQGIFVENYKEKVIGKNINRIKLKKIAGSSLTPQGFNDALKKIKSQAGV